MMVLGECVACGRRIQFNPDYVPSIRVADKGEREPLCQACFYEWNRIHRVEKELKPMVLHRWAYSPESDE